jgi:hypothetical protein
LILFDPHIHNTNSLLFLSSLLSLPPLSLIIIIFYILRLRLIILLLFSLQINFILHYSTQINDRVLQNILVAATLPSYGLRSIEKYIEKRFPLVRIPVN